MKKTVYLMRHGQTLFNLQKKIQGWCDSPLTDLGIYQAKVAGNLLKSHDIKIDHAYCSTLERASDTLEIVLGSDFPYKRLKGLKEWNFGAFEGKDECLNPKLPYGSFFTNWGGEDEMELRSRMVKTITEIMEKEDHQNVFIVSHGASIAQFFRAFEKYSDFVKKERFYNCCILKYEYEDGIFKMVDIYNKNITDIE